MCAGCGRGFARWPIVSSALRLVKCCSRWHRGMDMGNRKTNVPPVLCVVGKKRSGKTRFMELLVPELKRRGLCVGTVKHDAHGFDIDHEGKDSWRHRHCGADAVCIASPGQVALVRDVAQEPMPEDLAASFLSHVDIVLTEGYYRSGHPKVEVHWGGSHEQPLCAEASSGERNILALVTDDAVSVSVPRFAANDAPGVADLICGLFGL